MISRSSRVRAPFLSHRAPAPVPSARQRRPGATIARQSARSPDSYAKDLSECESSGDWVRALELWTEVSVLKVELPGAAVEGAIRTLASGGQWQKSVAGLRSLKSRGHAASAATVQAVFSALAAGNQAETALELLQELESDSLGSDGRARQLSAARNMVVRVLASSGQQERAAAMLETMVMAADDDEDGGSVRVEAETFNAVVRELLKVNTPEAFLRADEILEMRDYL